MFLHLLTLIFVVFKLLGMFDHSWWVVFSPMVVLFFCYMIIGLSKK